MTLQLEKRTVLTVITEAGMEKTMLRDLKQLGVRGYTVLDARGQGGRGVRDAAWGEAANIRIEVICSRALAETVLQDFLTRYYDNYAMVAFLQDVEIVRPDKF
ncbi:MAG: transcriptional regulator [Polaromonas sp.]|nr:transcriptional regulator [Polaromonas sp.]